MLKASYSRYLLHFKNPSGTSRGILTEKETWFVRIWDDAEPEKVGIGECALFRGLSAEDCPGYEGKLAEVCRHMDGLSEGDLHGWSSIRFGVETALKDLAAGGRHLPFPSPFTEGREGIVINGLVWMGKREEMLERIREKLAAGFRCIKLKIGAIGFEEELSLLKYIRKHYPADVVELRVDANGAFRPDEAMARLERLAAFSLHSIEQPIARGNWREMERICRNSPLPVALDEEVIGVEGIGLKRDLISSISPRYIILKPALCGGFSGAEEWIRLAREMDTGWWVTSALESNIGLNALAQWTATLGVEMPQGLGTGQLYTDNVCSPLEQKGEKLWYNPGRRWDSCQLVG